MSTAPQIHPDTRADTTADTAAGVLAGLRTSRQAADREEVRLLRLAVDWAAMHSVDSIDEAAVFGDPCSGDVALPAASVWARVVGGDLVGWRARRIARASISQGLSPEAAAFVDAQVAGFAHKIGPCGVDRLVQEAVARFMPAQARRRRQAAADGRHVGVNTGQVSFEGTVWLEGEADLADGLDLDAALGFPCRAAVGPRVRGHPGCAALGRVG